MEEEVLDLRKYLWRVLLKWRMLFVWGIIFAVLLCGYKYYKAMKTYKAQSSLQNETTVENVSDIQTTLSAEDRAEVSSLITIYDQINKSQEFIDNDALMKVDPYNEKVLSLQFYIKLKQIDDISSAETITDNNASVNVYEVNLSNIYGEYAETEAIVEIIKNNMSSDIAEEDITSLIRAEYSTVGGVFSVNIIYFDGMDTDGIASQIEKCYTEKSKELQNVTSHELVMTGKSLTTKMDSDLVTTKNTYVTQLYNLQNYASILEGKLSEEQKSYMKKVKSIISSAEADNSVNETNEIAKPSPSIKYGIVGFVLGIIIVCGYVFVAMLFDCKLSSVEDLTNIYKLQVFGELQSNKKSKKPFEFVDKKIYRLRDRNKKSLSYEKKINGIVTGIALSCQMKEIGKIVLSGTEIENVEQNFIDDIVKGLNDKNINVDVVTDIFYDSEALIKCSNIGTLVIIEVVESSIKNEIANQLKKSSEYHIDVLGAIGVQF